MSGSLEEHEPQARIFTAFTSSPKLSLVFLQLVRYKEYMFSISFKNHHDDKKGKQVLYFER